MLSCSLQLNRSTALPVAQRTLCRLPRRKFAVSADASGMPDQVVVCGGGIIGVATAYYLTLHGVKPILVEKQGIACAASGVAFSPAPLVKLKSPDFARVLHCLNKCLSSS